MGSPDCVLRVSWMKAFDFFGFSSGIDAPSPGSLQGSADSLQTFGLYYAPLVLAIFMHVSQDECRNPVLIFHSIAGIQGRPVLICSYAVPQCGDACFKGDFGIL